jgi:sugar fermentation stimulation protein A
MAARVPGSYLLLLRLDEASMIAVGKLGTFAFAPGWYVYAGSALGGLDQRLAHHLNPSGARRWHLDYLRDVAVVCDVCRFPGQVRRECDLARAVRSLDGAAIPVPRFGASDCRCAAHLVYFPNRPDLSEISGRIVG